MNLIIKDVEKKGVYRTALCLEDGTVLPNQLSLNVQSSPGEVTVASVDFMVDDNKVRYIESKPVKRWKWAVCNCHGDWFVTEDYYSAVKVKRSFPTLQKQPILATERIDYE